jgi:hypothetical protein
VVAEDRAGRTWAYRVWVSRRDALPGNLKQMRPHVVNMTPSPFSSQTYLSVVRALARVQLVPGGYTDSPRPAHGSRSSRPASSRSAARGCTTPCPVWVGEGTLTVSARVVCSLDLDQSGPRYGATVTGLLCGLCGPFSTYCVLASWRRGAVAPCCAVVFRAAPWCALS